MTKPTRPTDTSTSIAISMANYIFFKKRVQTRKIITILLSQRSNSNSLIQIFLERRYMIKYLQKKKYNYQYQLNKLRHPNIKLRSKKTDGHPLPKLDLGTSTHFETFEYLCWRIRGLLSENLSLSPDKQVYLLFYYLKHRPPFSVLADLFNISASTVSRLLTTMVPIANEALNGVITMDDFDPDLLHSIDCTCHPIQRVHPGQIEYYRGDVHSHFITCQLLVSEDGDIKSVVMAKGHNNDGGLANISGMTSFVKVNDILVLADQGYSCNIWITPVSKIVGNNTKNHAAMRSNVEIKFGH
eukprot:gene20023-23998_t